MTVRRREFLGGAVAGAGTVLTGCSSAPLTPEGKPAAKTFDPFDVVTLGKTGIKTTRVGIGTGMKGWKRQSNHTRMGAEKFDALIGHAWDRGIRLFDVADLYGTHPFLARAMKKMPRDKYVLISKVWLHPNGLVEPERESAGVAVRRFLKELQTDYIDVVLLHCQQKANWPELRAKDMAELAELKTKGVIRAHGVSVHTLDALATAVKEPWVDSVNARINPYGAYMDGPAEKVAPVLKDLHQAGKGVVGMKIIGQGKFRDSDEQRDASVRYVLNLGCVDAMVVGFETPAEVDDLVARVRKVPREAKA
jgi:aryl-alcohol dehydrogenase-like predicted oxidoreductase